MTTPQDGYGVDSTSPPNPTTTPTPSTPSTPPKSPAPNKGSTSSLECFLHGLFLLLLILAFFGFLVWMDIRFESEVVSRQSIGRFVRMSGAGGLFSDVVIETETGFYVLHGTPAIAKGAGLLLEVRESGAHYICDESRNLCLRTSSKIFKANDVEHAPNAANPNPSPSPSPLKGQRP